MAGRGSAMAARRTHIPVPLHPRRPSAPRAHSLSSSAQGSPAPWLLRGSAGGWKSVEELDAKLAELVCTRHAMDMNLRINDMLSRGDISFLGTESSVEFRRLSGMVEVLQFEHKFVETLDVMVENIDKVLLLQPPGDAERVQVTFSWSVTRGKVQGMRNEEFSARIHVNGEKVVEVNELDTSVAEQHLRALRQELQVPDSIPDSKFAWIISFFCTFPSDYAFDIVSEQLNT